MSNFSNESLGETGPVDPLTLPRKIGDSNLVTYPLALGTAVFGWTLPSGRSIDMLDRFVELGGSMIDTADSYSSGRAEQIIGTWMRERKNRQNVIVATKIGRHPDFPGLSPRSIRGAVDASLERLQTDYIDLLYFHADDDSVALEDSLAVVEELIQAGKVKNLGASNFSADRLLEARVVSAGGLPRFQAITVEYSLMRRDIVEGNLAMMAQAQGISVMPYFILANGYLGRHRNIRDVRAGDIRGRRASQYVGRHGSHVLRVLDDIAMSHGVDISTIAVAWTLSRPGVGICSIGVESMSELEALMHAPHIRLSRTQRAELDRVSAEHVRSWGPNRNR